MFEVRLSWEQWPCFHPAGCEDEDLQMGFINAMEQELGQLFTIPYCLPQCLRQGAP